MSSALTRRVFRQLIASEAITQPRCVQRRRPIGVRSFSRTARTQFFEAFREPPSKRELKPENIEPGFREMQNMSDNLRLGLRPPPRAEIVSFFGSFVNHRRDRQRAQEPTTDLHIEHALKTFQYLQSSGEDGLSHIRLETLAAALEAIARDVERAIRTPENLHKTMQLARLIYDELVAREAEFAGANFDFHHEIPHLYSRICSHCGPPVETLQSMLEYLENNEQHRNNPIFWRHCLRAATRTREDANIDRVLDQMRRYTVRYDELCQQIVIRQLIALEDFEAVKRWYLRPIDTAPPETSRDDNLEVDEVDIGYKSTPDVFWLCLEHGDLEYAGQIVHSVMAKASEDRAPSPRDWALLFAWGAVNQKSIPEIQGMMSTMAARSKQAGSNFQIKMSTINALMKVAMLRNDTYMVESYMAMAASFECKPDFRTYIQLIDYRLKHKDIERALEAYRSLQKVFIPDIDPDIPVANRLILAMCQQQYSPNAVMQIVMGLVDRKARLSAPVVTALCMLHLQKDELHDAIDLLRTYAWQFTTEERTLIKDEIVKFCLNPEIPGDQAWDSYVVLNGLFEHELDRNTRQEIMTKIFSQNRPDIAVHVFGHLRQSHLPERRPTNESYTLCFEGIAATGGDPEIFKIVNNMLKLDQHVDPDTRLYNALMLAHIATGEEWRAFKIWKNILSSKEGPTYSSFRIALLAAEQDSSYGLYKSHDIWKKLNESNIDITPDLHISYAWALTRHGELDKSFALLESMSRKLKQSPNVDAIACLWNAAREPNEKVRVQKWATQNHPQTWAKVQSLPMKDIGRYFEEEVYIASRGIRA